MHTTPASLLERLRQPGERESWVRFIELYTPLLYHWARRARLQEADAADLVQDVLTLLVQKLPEFTYDRHKSFRAWLRTVTLNKWRERLRCRVPMPLDAQAAPLAELCSPDPVPLFEEAEYRQHLVNRALQLMKRDFQPTTWRACWEHVVCGRPVTLVAAELGISAKAVYLAKGRVLRRLREELEGLLD